MWALVAAQPDVPAPGQNEKTVAYGGVDYATGRITDAIVPTKSGANFLAFLKTLVRAYSGRKIRLVCDYGRFHHTKVVAQWLNEHRHQIKVFWLPPYSLSLKLIERLWGHLKRTMLANVLFETIEDLVAAFRNGIARINGRRDRMGFVFDHDNTRMKTG
jgi:transposase